MFISVNLFCWSFYNIYFPLLEAEKVIKISFSQSTVVYLLR